MWLGAVCTLLMTNLVKSRRSQNLRATHFLMSFIYSKLDENNELGFLKQVLRFIN